MSLKSMISKIYNKDFKSAQTDFNEIVSEKIGEALNFEKIKIAGQIYHGLTTEDFISEAKKSKKNDDDDDEEDDDDDDDDDEEDDDEEDDEEVNRVNKRLKK